MPNPFPMALTFDDILIQPAHSQVLPKDARTHTQLTKSIKLNIPLLSAAMDTVTEARTAITMAQNGGLGIIHKNLSIDEQAKEVERVKKAETGVVVAPITLAPDATVQQAFQIMTAEGISGFPVVKNKKVVGILTNRDLRFVSDLTLKVSDLMTKDVITIRENFKLDDAKKLLQKHRIEKLLVVDANNNLKGLITVKDIEKTKTFPFAVKDELSRLLVGAATGVGDEGLARAEALIAAGVDVIVVDTAHGHSEGVLQTVRALKKRYKKLQVIAGNIATSEATKALIDAGVDAVKVGVGPGSICTTRVVSGVGVPQVYALQQCVGAAQKAGIPVISDGGIKYSGDVVKALAVGASAVMIGSLFAGADESPGDVILYQGRSYKVYRGMGSLSAMREGSKDRYFQSDTKDVNKLVPEGIEGRVPHRGPLTDSIYQLIGGLRSGMGYVGAATLKDLRAKAKIVQMTAAGFKESHVHDVIITKEAPNYRLNQD